MMHLAECTHIKNRQAKNEERPFSQNWAPEMIEKMQIWVGIQMSGPRRLLMSWDGSSASSQPTFCKVLPRL